MDRINFLLCLLVSCASAQGYQATIYRGSFGVPHIKAESLVDAAFGDGYAQAEDRLPLLMGNIRMANGTRAAAGGRRFVQQDYMSRLTGARRFAYQGWDQQSGEMRSVFEAFAAGVNRFIEEHRDQLSDVVSPVEPQEVLALILYAGLGRQFSQARKDRAGEGRVPIAGEGGPRRSGDRSNGWVLAPSRSASVHPIVLTDPHTPWVGINRWYEKHYITPQVNIYGGSMTGMPIFIYATTDNVSWSLTRNPGDRGDCFKVKLNPRKAEQYFLDGQPTDLKKIEETIEVRGSTPAKRVIYETVHGPVFAREGNAAFAAGMSLYSSDVGCEQLLRMVLAGDVKEFSRALSMRQLDGANIFCADVKGNIFYGWANRLMIRNDKYNWEKTVDGSTSKTLYGGVLAFEKMPQSMNDAGGYYQASNGADWMLEEGAWGLKPSDFPKWLLSMRNRKYLSARPQRVVDLLRSRSRHTLEQSKVMALDTRVLAAEWIMPVLERAVSELGDDDKPQVGEAMSILRRWVKNGPTATITSRGYSIFREICAQLGRGSNLVDARNILGLPESVNKLPLKSLRQLHSALVKAVNQLLKLYGTVSVEWGRINVVELADGRQFPCGAGDAVTQTPWQGTQNLRGKDGKWRVNGGSDFMMLTELGNPPTIYTLVPYGQSDDPKSRHFADQTERWTEGRWKRGWFTLEDVRRDSESKKDISN